jgi:hypothetical protein
MLGIHERKLDFAIHDLAPCVAAVATAVFLILLR